MARQACGGAWARFALHLHGLDVGTAVPGPPLLPRVPGYKWGRLSWLELLFRCASGTSQPCELICFCFGWWEDTCQNCLPEARVLAQSQKFSEAISPMLPNVPRLLGCFCVMPLSEEISHFQVPVLPGGHHKSHLWGPWAGQ